MGDCLKGSRKTSSKVDDFCTAICMPGPNNSRAKNADKKVLAPASYDMVQESIFIVHSRNGGLT